jgi:tetratricopeptide (TPR) repeat protein
MLTVAVTVTVGAILALSVACFSSVAWAQSTKPSGTTMARAMALQAKAWKAFYAKKYEEAAKQCDKLAGALMNLRKQRGSQADPAFEKARLEAGHCLARCWWAQRTRAGRNQARKIWAAIGKTQDINAHVQRQALAKALQAQAEGRPEKALKLLEDVVKRNLSDTCTAEAALELSRMYVAARRFVEAEKMLVAVSACMEKCGKNGEIPAAVLGPFSAALAAARKQLKYDEDAGRLEFEAAEKLRKEEKYVEAVTAYRAVVRNFPDSDYAPRSAYQVGLCLKLAGETKRAVQEWERFVAALPAGPWRGQAYAGLVTLCLEREFDLDQASRYATLAEGQLASALKHEASAESWEAATFDVHLMAGMVAFIQSNGAAAAEKFGRAQKTPRASAAATQGLPELIAAAKRGRPLLPDDVLGQTAEGGGAADIRRVSPTERRVCLVLSMGAIYNLAGRFASSQMLFEAVQAVEMRRRASPAQRSYAAYGLGVSLEGQRKPLDARPAYEASLKTFRRGSWHDETLFRLAAMIQREADKTHARIAPGSGNAAADKPSARSKRPTKKERDKQAAAEKAHQLALAQARAEALPYWQELIKRHRKSPYVETAAMSVGLLYRDLADWPKAVATFEEFVGKYPESMFQGEALWVLARCQFEEMLEPVAAKKYYEQLDAWIKPARAAKPTPPPGWETVGCRRPGKAGDDTTLGADGRETRRVVLTGAIPKKREPGEKPKSYTDPRYFDELESEAAKSLGFLAFVDGRKDEASAYYGRTESLDRKLGWADAKNPRFSDCARLRWGLQHDYLYAYPQELAQYHGRQRFAVLLGDYYYVTQRFAKAKALTLRMLDDDVGRLADAARVYPQYLKATCVYWMQGREAAFEEYMAVIGAAKSVVAQGMPFTMERAVYAASTVACQSRDPKVHEAGRKLLRQLAMSGRKDEFAYKARISYALLLVDEGQQEAGKRLLKSFSESAGEYKKIAEAYLGLLAKAARNQSTMATPRSKGDRK